MVVDEYFRVANQIECVFWNCFGLGFLLSAVKPSYRRLKLLAGLVLVVFGISDFVEADTGAWWDPWWLLLWKSACVLALAAMLFLYMKRQRKAQAKNAQAPPPSPDQ
jgi:hypothetical protein